MVLRYKLDFFGVPYYHHGAAWRDSTAQKRFMILLGNIFVPCNGDSVVALRAGLVGFNVAESAVHKAHGEAGDMLETDQIFSAERPG
jgi:hypothetical protein